MVDQPRNRHIPKEEMTRLLEESRSRCCLCRVLINNPLCASVRPLSNSVFLFGSGSVAQRPR